MEETIGRYGYGKTKENKKFSIKATKRRYKHNKKL
jgi:hypothetical protein